MTRGQSALEAIYLAQEGLEASRSIRDIGWEYLATGTHGLLYDDSSWSFAGTHELIGKFTRTISVGDLSENERQDCWKSGKNMTMEEAIQIAKGDHEN